MDGRCRRSSRSPTTGTSRQGGPGQSTLRCRHRIGNGRSHDPWRTSMTIPTAQLADALDKAKQGLQIVEWYVVDYESASGRENYPPEAENAYVRALDAALR